MLILERISPVGSSGANFFWVNVNFTVLPDLDNFVDYAARFLLPLYPHSVV